MSTLKVGLALSDQEIWSVYEQLGLATASDRARFAAFENKPQPIPMDVVISTSSQPFNG